MASFTVWSERVMIAGSPSAPSPHHHWCALVRGRSDLAPAIHAIPAELAVGVGVGPTHGSPFRCLLSPPALLLTSFEPLCRCQSIVRSEAPLPIRLEFSQPR